MVLLVLPIFDRMGGEFVNTAVRSDTEAAERFRGGFRGAWRVVIGIAAILVISGLWNLDLVGRAKGENAPAWADTGFDIVVTLLIVYLIWRLIRAVLHTEKHVAGGAEDADPSSV